MGGTLRRSRARGWALTKLLFEAHNKVFTMHPGGNKMYQDLKQHYWWKGMKRDVTEYMSKCLSCQQVKLNNKFL